MRNGGLIGKVNEPAPAYASGVWTLDEVLLNRAALKWPAVSIFNVSYIVAAGGGGGGTGFTFTGGGGAGGYITGTQPVSPELNTFTVTVGAGGAASSNGSNSSFGSNIAIGGGAGANTSGNGANGGSGGGASIVGTAGQGTSGQGNSGGIGSGSIPANGCVDRCSFDTHPVCTPSFPGGGGGAGGIGTGVGGGFESPGGPGVTASLPNYSTKTYCAGGPGQMPCAGLPAGTANTGNGGGGKGSGGSGEVVLVYSDSNPAPILIGAGLQYTVTVSGGYRRYVFTGGTGTVSWA